MIYTNTVLTHLQHWPNLLAILLYNTVQVIEESSSVYLQSKCSNYFCRLSITDFNCSIASSPLLLMSKTPSLYPSLSHPPPPPLYHLWVKRCVAADAAVSHSITSGTRQSDRDSKGPWQDEKGEGSRATDKWQRAITCDRCWPPVANDLHLPPLSSPLSPLLPGRHQVNYSALSQAFYFNLFFGYILIYLINFNRNAATGQQELPSFIKTTQTAAATTTTTTTTTIATTRTARTTTKEKVNILLHLALFIFCVCLSSADGRQKERGKKKKKRTKVALQLLNTLCGSS